MVSLERAMAKKTWELSNNIGTFINTSIIKIYWVESDQIWMNLITNSLQRHWNEFFFGGAESSVKWPNYDNNHLRTSNANYYTIWLFNIAMGNGPFIDGLAIKNGDFPWLSNK